MFEVYRQSAFVVVLLEQSDFGNSPEFTLNKAAILNLKCWTQGIWTAQEHLYANQNGDIKAAEILPIFYKVKECRIRCAVNLVDAVLRFK
ncbi:2901_t:CDS:2 [Gigaspora rosea]|nr:2901_t:CDS:2 [Gigaspora rosea]